MRRAVGSCTTPRNPFSVGAMRALSFGPEGRVVHAQRREDVLLREDVERLAGDAADDFAEEDVVDVGVAEDAPGRFCGTSASARPDAFVVALHSSRSSPGLSRTCA
jgi:hypothetical protein